MALYPADHAGLEILPFDRCLQLRTTVAVGRVSCFADGEIVAAVRPTPWRQAVDLADMMLTLALASTPEHVYERALNVFAADDVAEAFAACRSITVPSQLRSLIRADGRDLIGCFRRLAPARRSVPVQLWDIRRVAITAGLLAMIAAAVALFGVYLKVAGLL